MGAASMAGQLGFPKEGTGPTFIQLLNLLMTKDRSQMVIQQAARAGCVQQTFLCHQIRKLLCLE